MLGKLVSFWDCQFSGAMLVSGWAVAVHHISIHVKNKVKTTTNTFLFIYVLSNRSNLFLPQNKMTSWTFFQMPPRAPHVSCAYRDLECLDGLPRDSWPCKTERLRSCISR